MLLTCRRYIPPRGPLAVLVFGGSLSYNQRHDGFPSGVGLSTGDMWCFLQHHPAKTHVLCSSIHSTLSIAVLPCWVSAAPCGTVVTWPFCGLLWSLALPEARFVHGVCVYHLWRHVFVLGLFPFALLLSSLRRSMVWHQHPLVAPLHLPLCWATLRDITLCWRFMLPVVSNFPPSSPSRHVSVPWDAGVCR